MELGGVGYGGREKIEKEWKKGLSNVHFTLYSTYVAPIR